MDQPETDSVEKDLAEINELCARWPGASERSRPAAPPTTVSYVSKVPQALNLLNRAAKDGSATDTLDEVYEMKVCVLLVCARLGWARDASEGYQVDRYLFHCPVEIDCSEGNETRRTNLDQSKVDDYEAAKAILEGFLERYPLTPNEEDVMDAYDEGQARERLAYEARCEARDEVCEGVEEDEFDDFDDNEFLV